jgi:hypothetical protein
MPSASSAPAALERANTELAPLPARVPLALVLAPLNQIMLPGLVPLVALCT